MIFVIRQSTYGIVYEAVERSSRRKVAIKEYLPSALADRTSDGQVVVRSLRHQPAFREGMQAFLTEARTLAAVDEPALVKVLHVWEQHGTAYMTMPLHEGRTLKDALRESERPSEAWLKRMLAPLLDALATLHEGNYYPCDATPDNIVLLPDESPLLFDFGLTRRVIAHATDNVAAVLKPGYAPIEQYVKDPSMPEGPWTDIYAVAAVIYLAITQKAPTAPTTRMVADTMQPLRDVTRDYSERFLDGVDRGLAVRPEHRPQSIAEFRSALGIPTSVADPIRLGQPEPPAVEADNRDTGPPPLEIPAEASPYPPSQAAASRRARAIPWKLASLVVVVALAAIGILVWMKGESSNTPSAGASVKSNATRPVPEATVTPYGTASTPSAAPIAQTPAPDVTPARETPPSMSAPEIDQRANAAGGTPNRQVVASAKPPAASAAPVRPAAPSSGKVQFSIKPWGEILVDGKSHGVSPPVKRLSIPEGRHRIEIRNSTFPRYASEIDVKAGSTVAISHTFNAP